MKERPILFSGPMVRAILDGRKTVTRRIVRERLGAYSDGSFVVLDKDGDPIDVELRRPYGGPGDRLWVRETFASLDVNGHKSSPREAHFVVLLDGAQVYRDGTVFAGLPEYSRGAFDGIKWRPSIHMPRWASRILLEVVSVRVERLQEITEEDARREGLDRNSKDGGRTWKYGVADRDGLPGTDDDGLPWHEWSTSARTAFAKLWDRINGKRAPWASNPWVWRVEFRRVS